MPVLDHSERFQSAFRQLRCGAKRRKGISSRPKHNLVVVNNQNINRIKHHIIPLPVSQRNIQYNSKGRPFSLFALTVNCSADQFDHLFCNGQAQTGSLNAVDTAVDLTRERLIHRLHEFRAHSDAGV